MDKSFFEESKEQSQIKSRIVQKYFWAWSRVIIPSARRSDNRILYVDLFAGPGRYEDGTLSTPLLVLEKAIADPSMREMLVTRFNDKDAETSSKLRAAIDALPGIRKLKYEPYVSNEIVGEQIAKMFAEMRLIPTFFFVDPWGYKGLSLRLINSVLQNWGCDCVFFFNYNRVNMGLNNPAVREHMNALFGKRRANELRTKLLAAAPGEREVLIIEDLCQALKDLGATFVLPFTFKNALGTRTTHHLIFASKDFKGYEIMKEIMAKESSETNQGVPSFEYNPASERTPLLFELSSPLDQLEGKLQRDFSGEHLTMYEVYRRHSVDTPYVKANYKRALANLEATGEIIANPPASERRMRKGEVTFADDVRIDFPRRKKCP